MSVLRIHYERPTMSDFNSQHNRVVWVDIPVADLDRANRFYAAVLGVSVHNQTFRDFQIAAIDHKDGNGGCLIVEPQNVSSTARRPIDLNVNGRIHAAV